MEGLLAYALLTCKGFDSEQEYETRLHEMFLANPKDNILLELELMSGDMWESAEYIKNNMHRPIDKDVFGRIIVKRLEAYYRSMELREFAPMAYELWRSLPSEVEHEQPFFTMNYADDPISYGDEEQSRVLYEDIFGYYNND